MVPPAAITAADNASPETARTTNCLTDSTGSPRGSASSTDTDPASPGVMRTRSRAAPAACSDTPCQENGSIN